MLEMKKPKSIHQIKPLQIKKDFELNNISFAYSFGEPKVLKNICLKIKFGERIGIVGSTGSGKSTLIDIILGLLAPNIGQIIVDGEAIHNDDFQKLQSWRLNFSHVPQNIFLSDATFAENIAFGISPSEIDIEMVKKAAEKAKISQFIESRKDNYYSIVGERGVSLSGGQKQRIAIARAFYRKSKIIIFDEATSALDQSTEEIVMNSIDSIAKDVTLIIIAHRLSTLKNCSRIIRIEKGLIIDDGSPREVLR